MDPFAPDIGPATAGSGDVVQYQQQREGEAHLPETQDEAEAKGPDEVWTFWNNNIKAALIGERRWRTEADDCEKLYFGEDSDPGASGADDGKSNRITDKQALIHGNIDVLKPMLYSETPAPIVRRRFRGDGKTDETDLMAAEIGQRLAQYIIDTECFDDCMESVRDDWLIAGRGVARAFYSAEFATDQMGAQVKTRERVYAGHSDWRQAVFPPTKSYRTLPWMALENDLTRTQFVQRFGQEAADKTSFDHMGLAMSDNAKREDDQDVNDRLRQENETNQRSESVFDTCKVFEIWVKETGKVLWWSPSYKDGLLDEIDDPLGLEGFWPMPRPITATTKGESLNPRPDIKYYERRAKEIDEASNKLKTILEVVSISGLFPGSMADEVKKVLQGENIMVPVQDWIALMEKGGTSNIVQWLPLDAIIGAMQALIALREQAKQAMFEASGVSDIMRAQGDPSETATAQSLKGRYSGLRLRGKQRTMAYYARDMLRILVELALEHFDLETIAQITGLGLPLTEAERQGMQMQAQMAMQQYQQQMAQFQQLQQAAQALQAQGIQIPNMPQPPEEPDIPRIPQTSYELVHARLRDDFLRKITLTVETDSTILADEQEDKEARVEFLAAFTNMVTQLMPLVGTGQFDLKTIKEMLLFGLRGFPKSRTLESLIAELPEESQQEPPEDAAVTVAKIKGEVDKMLAEMDMQNHEADRQHEMRMKGVEVVQGAAEMAAEGAEPPQTGQGA